MYFIYRKKKDISLSNCKLLQHSEMKDSDHTSCFLHITSKVRLNGSDGNWKRLSQRNSDTEIKGGNPKVGDQQRQQSAEAHKCSESLLV